VNRDGQKETGKKETGEERRAKRVGRRESGEQRREGTEGFGGGPLPTLPVSSRHLPPLPVYFCRMSLVKTAAIVLHAFKYSESSKIVRLATEDVGIQSAIAKGALRPKSKFGARLQVLSEGIAELYLKPNRELQTLSEFAVSNQHAGLAGDVRRYGTAAALAELVLRSAPAEPNPAIFQYLAAAVSQLDLIDPGQVDTVAIGVLWGAVSVLGFAPAVDGCARDGRRLPEGAVSFSVAEGGFLCSQCAAHGETTRIGKGDRQVLESFVHGAGDGVGSIPPRHAAAHRRLLRQFIQRHLSEDRELKALDFWETLSWNDT